MKKIITLFLFVFFITTYLLTSKNNCPNTKAKIYQVNNKNYCLLTASNQEQWEKGLMFYKNKEELKGVDGMIFVFPDKQMRSFWNKNTYLDLNIYWLNDDKIVGKSFLPSILKSKETVVVKSPDKVNRVVEIIF